MSYLFNCFLSPYVQGLLSRTTHPDTKTLPSSQTCADLPDGGALSEEIRSEKRRPFTEEEDRALRAGYGGRGTIWAQIVKDSIIQEQRRQSVDLRDLLNTFPGLYEGAQYDSRPVPILKIEEATAGDSAFPSSRVLPDVDPQIVERVVGPISLVVDDKISPVPCEPSKEKRANISERFSGSDADPQSGKDSDDVSPVPVTAFLSVTPTQLLSMFQSSPFILDLHDRISRIPDKSNKQQASFLVLLFASVFPPGLVTTRD